MILGFLHHSRSSRRELFFRRKFGKILCSCEGCSEPLRGHGARARPLGDAHLPPPSRTTVALHVARGGPHLGGRPRACKLVWLMASRGHYVAHLLVTPRPGATAFFRVCATHADTLHLDTHWHLLHECPCHDALWGTSGGRVYPDYAQRLGARYTILYAYT